MPPAALAALDLTDNRVAETTVLPHIKARVATGKSVTKVSEGRHLKATDKFHNPSWNFSSKYFPRRHFTFTGLTLIRQKSKHNFIRQQQLYSKLLKLK
ncbi:hypothetical protein PYH37_003234 [Sinorhizobium numidicum]|uniref:Uncharacterized protein n=1 Tax=Sinorhizobium numidicum TaxID=680248 RepID=A0ABY8D2A2_9HYPH|nr:hypothetical protein [Sinorhizobium numidicum]WEX78355.1 hypothetical protein PYH37_003234 [Sinorhizobium numidicum]WEX85014.1 hypothetical protein PYH38_003947 [Sinorhizobium numidicum]